MLPKGVSYTLAFACAIAVALLGYVVLNKPLTDWRSDLTQRADLVRAKLAEGPNVRRQHAEQEKQLADLLEHVEQVNRRVPNQALEGEFLAELSRVAKENSVTIDDFRRGATAEAETHSVVTVTVTARGSHRGLCGVIDAIARLPRLAELTRMQVTSVADPDGYPVELNYALYYGMATPTPGSTASL